MKNENKKAVEAASYIEKQIKAAPRIAVITGTGLGGVIEMFDVQKRIPYNDIPHFNKTGVISHSGELIFGRSQNHPVIILNGRIHLYEGWSPYDTVFSIRSLKALGVHNLIITNASGGLNQRYNAGDILVINDHINLTGENPLIGSNDDALGDRFPDMSHAYDPELIKTINKTAEELDITVQNGVYAGLKGPSLETPAEVRFLQTIGADAVGFSTVMEVIAAVHMNMRVAALSAITNVHRPDNPEPADVGEIIQTAGKTAVGMGRIIESVVNAM